MPVAEALEQRFSDVAYLDAMATLVFKYAHARVYAVLVSDLAGADASPVTRVSLDSDGYSALVEQASGNRLEVPWDVVLYHAEPEYPYYKSDRGDTEEQELATTIGQRIRVQRVRRSWTQADLSERAGLKVPNLCRLEKGKHLPSLETLEKVADALGIPVAALVV